MVLPLPDHPTDSGRRREIMRSVRRVVVKIGTRVVTRDNGRLDSLFMETLAWDVSQLLADGLQVTVVSSGAVGAGLPILGLSERPRDLPTLQATAAAGQIQLMAAYSQAFGHYDRRVAQLLLTAGDVNDRERYLNIRNTLATLHKRGIVPVVNENDTVAVEELSFSDNDKLAAVVCDLMDADLLIILSDTDGLFDKNPTLFEDARRISFVENVTDEIAALAMDVRNPWSKGGMTSKLGTARITVEHGSHVLIVRGKDRRLTSVLNGDDLGTLFQAQPRRHSHRQRWVRGASRALGTLTVDAGAARALAEKGGSLLPAGVTRVQGTFHRGDAVKVVAEDGVVIAKGLVNYSSSDAGRLCGVSSRAIAETLGYTLGEEIIHRNNLILEEKKP